MIRPSRKSRTHAVLSELAVIKKRPSRLNEAHLQSFGLIKRAIEQSASAHIHRLSLTTSASDENPFTVRAKLHVTDRRSLVPHLDKPWTLPKDGAKAETMNVLPRGFLVQRQGFGDPLQRIKVTIFFHGAG